MLSFNFQPKALKQLEREGLTSVYTKANILGKNISQL